MSLSLPASATSEGGSSDSSSDIDTTASAASGAAANSDDASPDTDDFKRPCIVQVVDSPSLVEGPADVTYPSWSAWNEYLKAYSHNHAVGTAQFKTYAENRRLDDTDTKDAVDSMVMYGRKRARIYEYLLGRGENLVKKDVDNIVQRVKAEIRGGLNDDDACAATLAEFAAIDGNVVTVDETDAGHSGVISMTSRHMRDMVTRFPELLLVDCTHKTNRGQPVQQSLLERNADWQMSRALDHLFRIDDKIGDKVQVIMVDKDLNEIRVLRRYFPKSRVLICVFHVIKYLRTASRKPEYGKLSSDDHDAIDALVHNMVYVLSSEIYETNWTSMKALCTRTGYMAFYNYMDENWNTCTEMWVMYQRSRLAHLRVHTNNHLENWFGHFKDGVNSNMTMTDTVKALVGADARTSSEYVFDKTRIGLRVNRNYDEEMCQVLRFTTHFVATHVEKEWLHPVLPLQTKYNNAGSKKAKYTRESAPVLNENAFYLLPPKLLDKTGSGVRIVGVEAASASKKKKSMSEKMKTKVQELLTEADVLLIPVNFGNMHWCAMIVDGKQNNVLYYDSMNLKTYKDVLDRMSCDLATTLSDDFKVVSVNGPIQTDGYNCGFYVMLRFWRYVDKSVSLDVTPIGLTLLRFRILHFVLHGSKP
ncbi:SUMO protease, putative [Phytophthora infestans T30-4]|uniref:SUMO protease, putative n=1 Tax=Phytophthora infestans (strain T30-4) TaxID=403677 RepID=D0N0D9_PHYIT|nr:SUMO protease, putative [Phytophthora infestans T30-4]EEY67102.1 SUMO protease, putative [Phytophthora infestans T30-4]|eukprot:XP_002905750.1 SUMO protease, putative [Phytophthora infestans T30-4]